MPKVLDHWTVFPHGPLEQTEDRLLTVQGDIPLPLGRFPRRMTVLGLSGGRTAIWSPIALAEGEMARIEALGHPSFLIVPSGYHRMDARIWKRRYPEVKVVTPPGAQQRVAEVVQVDATNDILGDANVRFQVVAGSGDRESALVVRRKAGTTLIVNDVIGHVRKPRGFVAHVLTRLLGFGASGPQIPRDVKSLLIRDRKALAAQFEAWAADTSLIRIIVSHGELIDVEPAASLTRLAAELAA